MKRYDRGVSPQGNGNCEAGSETGMSYEFMYRAHRASTEGRMVGGGVGVWGDAEIGWRPTPEKNIETIPCWGKKIAQRIASWTWDVTHERALSTADLFGGKAPVGALIGLLERIR